MATASVRRAEMRAMSEMSISEDSKMKVRIKFRKYGVMKYIGHLDVMRYFQKAIRRAEIPIAYSEGFSPHQIMSFAAPLGVGLESNGEYMDIELREPAVESQDGRSLASMSCEQMKEALQKTMAEGMEIISVRKLSDTAGNAMASVAAAKYTVRFRTGYEPDFDWKSQLEIFYHKLTILVKKQTKKSIRELDIKPAIYELAVKGDTIVMTVDASSAGNIKPQLVMEAFYQDNGAGTLPAHALWVTREETYGRNKDTGRLVALEDMGIEE